MPKVLKRKSDDVVFGLGSLYEGGYLDILVTPFGECPIIVFDDAVDIIGDVVKVKPQKAVSDIFYVYDSDSVPVLYNPDYAAVPVIFNNPTPRYSSVGSDYDTTFEIAITNPNNYYLEFATNRMGTLNSGGYPITYQQVFPTNGLYLIETASHDTLQQTIYIRWMKPNGASFDPEIRRTVNYTPMPVFVSGGGGEPDPTLNPDRYAVPVIQSNPTKEYVNSNNPNSNTRFKLVINNPQNYSIQFSTKVVGGLNAQGLPIAYVTIPRVGGFYNVETLSVINPESNPQAIFFRFENSLISAMQGFANYVPFAPPTTTGGGGGTIGTGQTKAPYGGVPLYGHIWGNFGNDQPSVFGQGTYQDDVYAIQNLATTYPSEAEVIKTFPWYTQRLGNNPEYWDVSVWQNGQRTGQKMNVPLFYKFLLDENVMRQYIDYGIQAGLQGFMLHNYADDGYLSLFRRVFRRPSIDKRGMKICYSLNFGGEGRENYDSSSAMTAYRQSLVDMAWDVQQNWYGTCRKNGSQVPIFYAFIDSDNVDQQRTAVNNYWQDLSRLKSIIGGSIGDTFNILMTSGPSIGQISETTIGSADATGNVWNAETFYYNQPPSTTDFTPSSAIINAFLTNTPCANKVPMISWGYDSRPRWFYEKGQIPGYFNYQTQVLPYMKTLIDTLKGHMANGSKDLRLALCGQIGEFAEQGRDLFPNIDLEQPMLDIFKEKFG